MLLTFDQAKLKSGGSLPVTVRISALAASADAANESVALPGARVGGSANAGGSQQLTCENNDKTTLHSNIKQSGLEGVYLQPSPGGSGVVFAANGDVYLDANIQMVVQIASASARTQ
jgi:hypothetical protein